MVALYIKPQFPLMSFRTESSSENFVFLGSKRRKEIVSYDFLKDANIKESTYTILSSEMQTSIHALQKVDFLAKRWRAALSTSSVMIWKAPVLYTCDGVSDILRETGLENDTDSFLTLLEENPSFKEADWQIQNDQLLYKDRLYIQLGLLHRESLWLNHDEPLTGHFGYARTWKLFCRKYYWPGINQNVKEYFNTLIIVTLLNL